MLERAGKLTHDLETGEFKYKAITGKWWWLNAGDWVVLQQGGDVYGIEHEDFVRLFEEL